MTTRRRHTLLSAICALALALAACAGQAPREIAPAPYGTEAHRASPRLSPGPTMRRCVGCQVVTPKTLPTTSPPQETAPTARFIEKVPADAMTSKPPQNPIRLVAAHTPLPRKHRIPYAPGSATASSDALEALARSLSGEPVTRIGLRGSTSGKECATANRRLVAARLQGVRRFIEQRSPHTIVTIEGPANCVTAAISSASDITGPGRHVEVFISPAGSPSPSLAASVRLPKELP